MSENVQRHALPGLSVGHASVASEAHRTRNEDAWFALPDRGFFGVFDGMGAHAAADVAARMAAEEAQEALAPLAPEVEADAVADTIRDALFAADEGIRIEAQSRGDPRGMGTTALISVLRPRRAPRSAGTWQVIVGWVGDSRALLLADQARTLETLTIDDGVVRQHARSLAQARKVQAALGSATDALALSLRERDFFLERHVVLQAVGTSLRHVHVTERVLGEGDTLLLVTDGVHDNLTDREMATLVLHASSAQAAADRLVAAARDRSTDPEHFRAKPDDMTALVVRVSA